MKPKRRPTHRGSIPLTSTVSGGGIGRRKESTCCLQPIAIGQTEKVAVRNSLISETSEAAGERRLLLPRL